MMADVFSAIVGEVMIWSVHILGAMVGFWFEMEWISRVLRFSKPDDSLTIKLYILKSFSTTFFSSLLY